MAESEKSKHLKLKVANFGPIAKADIDLRPMTVFVGPSNTGKSYLAMLIYALHRFFSGESMIRFSPRDRVFIPSSVWPRIWHRWKDEDTDMSDEDVNVLVEWVKQRDFGNSMPDSIAALIRRRLRDVDSFGDRLNKDLARCFGMKDTKDIIRRSSDGGIRVDIDWRVLDHTEPFIYNFTLKRKGVGFDASVPDTIPLSMDLFDRDGVEYLYSLSRERESGEFRREFVPRVMNELSGAAGSHIVGSLSRPAYYLPADRTGVMHSHQALVSSLIANAPQAGFTQSPTGPALSGVLADFLERLIVLGDFPTRQSAHDSKLRERLERDMLRGEIIGKNSDIGYPEFSYRPNGWKRDIPLMNSSSMVSELAPVVLYLRHVVEPGDVLIIEEPESHLHPEMQVEFVRQLAAVVNAGIRVMLTTHSEWVLEELANLLQLEELRKARGDDFVDTSSALTQDQLGVWLFETKKSPKGTVVREIQLDLEIGNFPSGYDDVAMDVYNRWAKISNLIEESKS